MYKKILVALENSKSDRTLIPHIASLARHFKSTLLLVHVADGWAARNFERLHLRESEEMQEDRRYLNEIAESLRAQGLAVEVKLALGDPPKEILRSADDDCCDLIAMTTHGHRLLGDIIHGSTIHEVRHKATIPVLLVRAEEV